MIDIEKPVCQVCHGAPLPGAKCPTCGAENIRKHFHPLDLPASWPFPKSGPARDA